MQSLRVVAREIEVRRASFHPDQICVRRVRQAPRDHRVDSAAYPEEAFRSAFAGAEGHISFIDVAGQQIGSERIGTRDDDARNAADVRSQPSRVERTNVLACRNEDLAAEMPALLLGGELILPVHARGTGGDHAFHEFEGIQRSAEAGLSVSNDGDKPVTAIVSFR